MAFYYELESQNLIFGTQFSLDAANAPGNLNKAIAMISHEAAHAFQSKHGLLDLLVETNPHRVKCIELHADFVEGQASQAIVNEYCNGVSDNSVPQDS